MATLIVDGFAKPMAVITYVKIQVHLANLALVLQLLRVLLSVFSDLTAAHDSIFLLFNISILQSLAFHIFKHLHELT